MTAAEIIYRIKDITRGGLVAQEDPISNRLILHLVNTYRAKIIRQEIAKGNFLSGYYVQSLGLVELITTDKNFECTIENCVLRTKVEIPKPIDTNQVDLLTFVGSLDSKRYSRTTYGSSDYMDYGKYTGNKPRFYELDKYIFIINPPTKTLKYITIQGVFEDPSAAASLIKCGNTIDCYNDIDYEYPISATVIDQVISLVYNELKAGQIKPMDTLNDSRDQIVANS